MKDLGAIFKAYDVRGTYPDQLDEDTAQQIGSAFARFVGTERIALGRDMRTSSPSLAAAFSEGVASAGASVVDLGLVSTDALYFASGRLDLPGAMFTASHNPARYNGLKLCRQRAAPIGIDSGLVEIRSLAESSVEPVTGSRWAGTHIDYEGILGDYAAHCLSFIDQGRLRPLRVAIDAGNGMAGLTVPPVFDQLPFEVVPLFFELDGTFPNHPANPIEPQNLVDLQRAVTQHGCDLGLAFDGDADRVFLVDEHAGIVSGSATTALVAERLLHRNPGATVIYNLICSWSVREVIKEAGGRPLRSRVGHSYIKELMAEEDAVFAGEHSGHYYFRDNFRADSGMIAALLVLEALSEAAVPLSKMLLPYQRYFPSGEVNFVVADQAEMIELLAAVFADGRQDRLDGLTVEYDDWWFNCRPSNTEPLLRLNLEARTETSMEERLERVRNLIEGGGADAVSGATESEERPDADR
ncbi:MAG: phosphomannomutase/phosphoglucomutase [Actinomycetota bacterium]|nr:phosphomannomutase/phosphoglucomutase [Actinomycetota bacterium]